MRVIAITGSASGIGAAVRARLAAAGDRVIGVDVRDAEVIADLGHPGGRAAAVAGVAAACGGRLDGLVACAGVGPQTEPHGAIVAINYFGAVAILDGLHGALHAGGGAAVAIGSNAAAMPNADGPVVDACLAGDETGAVAAAVDGAGAYAGSKLALLRWVRRRAPEPAWAGAGVRLNAVAPGAVQTPLLQAGLDHPLYGPAIRGFPIPRGRFGMPGEVAAAVEFLLGPTSTFCCGSVLFVDGGTDALLRPGVP